MSESTMTRREALRIDEVSIREMAGIEEPFTLGPIGPGITVIHGPNAVGKSRAAEALQSIIWPDRADAGAHIRGQLSLGNKAWSVAARFGRPRWDHDGVSTGAAPASYAPPSQHDRYLLTLHDLLQADNRGFAELIQRESAGGYDLPSARRALGVATPPRSGAARERKDLDAARSTVRNLRQADRQLEERERSRQSLEDRRDRALLAESRIRLLEHALRHADAQVQRREREVTLREFAPVLQRLQGNEYDRVCTLLEQVASDRQQLHLVMQDVDRLEQVIVRTGFGEEGIPSEGVLSQVTSLVASMRQHDAELRQVALDLAAQQALLFHIPRLAEQGLNAANLAALNAGGLREFADISRKLRDVRANEHARIALERWLQTTVAGDDPEPLRRAIDLLARWLQVPGPDVAPGGVQRWVIVVAALIILLLSLVLAVISSPAWLAMAASAPVLVWAQRRRPDSSSTQERGRIEASFPGGVPAPSVWTPDTVISTMSALQERLAGALLEQEKRSRWASLGDERHDLLEEKARLAVEIERLRETFGVTLQDADPDELRMLAEAVDRWWQADELVAVLLARQEEIRSSRDSSLAEVNRLFRRLGASPCLSTAEVEVQRASTVERTQVARTAQVELERQRGSVVHLSEAVSRNEEQVDQLFQTAELENGDALGLRLRCEQTKPWREAQVALEQAETVVRTLAVGLEADPSLLERERADLEIEIAHLQVEAGQRDHLLEEIARLDRDLEQARHQTSLEEAVHLESMAIERLSTRRDQDMAAAVRWEIAEHIAQATRDLNRPRVFHAAREWFAQFTAGAWRLELEEGVAAAFYATEASTRRRCALTQLSSGTRVQLLMAVRIAFLDVSEDGPQLPLILDETLGNSDDARANAIIDATMEIARRGRQVVYFTAQQDEVHKWRSRIDERPGDIDFTEIDLAEVRGMASASRRAAPTWYPDALVQPQISAGLSHAEAREVLRVPPVNLWADHDDEIDLWYGIHDMESLSTLRQLGVRTWGQYQNLRMVRNGRSPLIEESTHQGAVRRMEIIQQTRRLWQQGRVRPMTLAELMESGAITDRFLDPVTQLAEALGWRADRVLGALRERRISGFRQASIVELETYCQERGLITDRQPLPLEEIRAQVWAMLHNELDEQSDDLLSEIDVMFGLLASTESAVAVS
jgi:hypothetical protein